MSEVKGAFFAQLSLEKYEQMRSDLDDALKALELIGGMAGNPDAKEACRLICKVVSETLQKIRGKHE